MTAEQPASNVIEERDWCLFTACPKAIKETMEEESNKEQCCPAERSFPKSASLFSREETQCIHALSP